MGSSYFVGIDNGGSSIKCVIFDQEGTPVSSASASVPLIRLNNGGTERDPDLLWQANCDAIRRALNDSGLRPDQITAVSLCGYGGGLVLLDGSGSCVHPVIVSTDSRAEDLLHVFQKDGTDDRVFSHTCQRLWPGQPGMLLPWFVRNDPDTLRRASHILAPKDYIRFRLTGQIATERTDASNTNLFSLYTDTFDPELFACLGISECLPKMPKTFRNPCDIAGTVTARAAAQTGLAEGTPVAAGLYDVASCTLASGILDESILSIVIGTWNISGHLVRNRAELETRSNGMCAFLPGWYFSEESSPTSASNLNWFVDQYYRGLYPEQKDIYEFCNRLVAAADPAASDLIFLPYLYGSNTSSGAKGCLLNLAGHHTGADVLRAVYEGILFSLLQHVDALYEGKRPASARFSGGPSRSSVWCQMLADVLELPIEVMECRELGALGAAICASVASGVYTDYADAVSRMTHTSGRYLPDPARAAIYRHKYDSYQKAASSMQELCDIMKDTAQI